MSIPQKGVFLKKYHRAVTTSTLYVSAPARDDEDMEAVTFKLDITAMQQWLAAWKLWPHESGKWTSRMVNDMAFEFKARFPEVIASRYTIRDRAFIKKTIKIDKARPRSHMADIVATVGTWYGSSGGNSSGGASRRFSGFTEELTGSPSTIAQPHHRVILPAGRKGKTMAGKAEPWARMMANQKIPSIIDTEAGLQNIPEESRFSAMARMMGQGRIPHSPSNTFILEGGRYKAGLYRFKGGALPQRGQRASELDLEMIQVFVDEPILPPRWDWPEEAAEKVAQKFTAEYIAENYIAKAILGILPGKK
jgi:hypothetical protein